jgi:hypothetical protein
MEVVKFMGQDSIVGIATGYGLDNPGIKSQWGQGFPHFSRLALWPTQPTIGTGSFPGVKQPGSGVNHPPPSSTEVKERVELYLYSLSVPSWQVTEWTLPL